MKEIRILYVNGGPLSRGGIESYMMNYYRNFDRNKIQIDFVSIGLQRAAYDEEIESLGGEIYYIPKKSKNYFGYIKALREIFKTQKYNIIHTHMDAMGMTVLREAKKFNIPIRIAHSHNTKHITNNFIKIKINEYARKNINKYATHMFACSEAAGRWLFGDKAYENGQVEIIKNAIDVKKFEFDEVKRKLLRKRLGILDSERVIGHIGRFDTQKNHVFILNMINEVVKENKMIKLILVGDGRLRGDIEKIIKKYNITNNVILLGNVDNTWDYYNTFDIFILPSLFEGLPVVGIEAQANGLLCMFSDTITRELTIGNEIQYLSINNTQQWVDILKDKNVVCERNNNEKDIIKAGYDIFTEAQRLQKRYMDLSMEVEYGR